MKKRVFTALIVFVVMFIVFSIRKRPDNVFDSYQYNEGTIFGTFYHITYESGSDYHHEIKDLLKKFDNSLSPFNKSSVITKVNQNDSSVVLDQWFETVFDLSKQEIL